VGSLAASLSLDSHDMLLRNYTAVGMLAVPRSADSEGAAWRRLAGRAGRERSASPVGTVHDFRDVLQVSAAHISVVSASRSSAGPSA
jgi:NADPH2:quinone reductase